MVTEGDTQTQTSAPTGVRPENRPYDLISLARSLVKHGASDLHLKLGRPPVFRINGQLVPTKLSDLKSDHLEKMLFTVMSPQKRTELNEKRQADFSFVIDDLGRFRCNVFFQKGGLSAVIRLIPMKIPQFDALGLPAALKTLVEKERGLFLICGPTGAGKSTTLAALVQHLNQTSSYHIVTIEDPIEFVHTDQNCSVTQREVGSDVMSFTKGLQAALRQDPDIILIGELRDYETIQMAITAAETGHLVLATLHTSDARSTVERIIDIFPAGDKNQVRIQLASCLVGVCVQQLIRHRTEKRRVPVFELMVKSPSIETHILKNEIEKIPEAIKNSSDYYGMVTFNACLEQLVKDGVVSYKEALKVSSNPDDLKLRFEGITRDEGY